MDYTKFNIEGRKCNLVLTFPLMMKLLEWAKENACSDESLHNVMEKLISFSDGKNALDMQVYDLLIGDECDCEFDGCCDYEQEDCEDIHKPELELDCDVQDLIDNIVCISNE